MLHNKHRASLRHLPPRQRWSSLAQGAILRLPATRIAGGWAAGDHDFYPWIVESLSAEGGRAVIRCLSCTRRVQTAATRTLLFYEEHAPAGVHRSRDLSPEHYRRAAWLQRHRPHPSPKQRRNAALGHRSNAPQPHLTLCPVPG